MARFLRPGRRIGTVAAARRWPRSFADRLTAPLPGPAQFLRLLREGGFRRDTRGTGNAEAAGVADDPARIPVAPRGLLPAGDGWLAWLGHASFLLRLGGRTVAVDPVLSERILGAGRRLTPPGLDRLPPLDLLLISHNHYDHLDAPSVRGLPRDTRVVAPGGLGRWFRRRGLFDHCASLWGGWVLTAAGGPRLYHAGDSGYGPFFTEIGARYPGIDIAMLPVGAYAPRWFMQPVHIDPQEAVRATQDVGARALVPMHWGTFRLSREPVLEPIERTRAAWAAAGRDPADLWDLAVGESRMLVGK